MNFSDGDRLIGQYGNHWQRFGGRWLQILGQDQYSETISDDTAEWLINLKVETLANKIKKTRKISKSETLPPESFIYKFTYIPKEEYNANATTK